MTMAIYNRPHNCFPNELGVNGHRGTDTGTTPEHVKNTITRRLLKNGCTAPQPPEVHACAIAVTNDFRRWESREMYRKKQSLRQVPCALSSASKIPHESAKVCRASWRRTR